MCATIVFIFIHTARFRSKSGVSLFQNNTIFLANVRFDVTILVDVELVEVLLFVEDFLALFGRVLSGDLAILEIFIISNFEKLFRTFENEMLIVDFFS